MTITFNSSVVIFQFWADFKSLVIISKLLPLQYEIDIYNDNQKYVIFATDGNVTYVCYIWLNTIPSDVNSYSQTQNDIDKSDWETNYRDTSNNILVKLSVTGVAGQSPSKGLGGFAPDPANNPYQPRSDEIVGLYVDGEGSLVTRGASITDEGSMRDDFTGTALETTLTGTLTFVNGSTIVTGTGTIFTKEVNRDYYIKLVSDDTTTWTRIGRAPNNTTLTLDTPYQGSSDSNTAEITRWVQISGGSISGTVVVGDSVATLSPGTANDGYIIIYHEADYLPFTNTWTISISQRISNQTIFFGVRDDINNPTMYCDIILDGYDATVVTFRSAWNNDEETSIISLPAGLDTSQNLRYKIDVSPDYCALLIEGVLVSRHANHVPDPYVNLILCAGITNTGSVAITSTNMVIDTMFFSNQDQVQIANVFTDPIAVVNREDQHSLFGSLTTTSTTSNQIIISYTVPNNKVFYIVGYRIQNSSSLSDNVVKIGKNDVSSIPNSPGIVDGNIFRLFSLAANDDTEEVDFSIPRKLGIGGDIIEITVTPSGSSSATWYAALEFVLR